jgi:hypothetical protein
MAARYADQRENVTASPLLASLFLQYAFDKWMEREYPGIVVERDAGDAVRHCESQAQAMALKQALEARMAEVGLELHPEKTRIVFCFSPAIGNKAAKGIRQRARRWRWPLRSDKNLEDLARMFNPIIQGWINYRGRYYKSALYPTLRQLDRRLVQWATRTYKRLRRHRRRAEHWLHRIAKRQRELFAHWRLLHATAGRNETKN